jgi:hypothetical protein
VNDGIAFVAALNYHWRTFLAKILSHPVESAIGFPHDPFPDS